MVSEFRKKKLVHVFHFFDTDKSGEIEKKDFDLAFQRISQARGWKSGDYKFDAVQNALNQVWVGLQSQADADNDGKVTQAEWISMWEEFAKNPSAAAEWQSLYCRFVFRLQDASDDGAVDVEEFSSVSASFGLNKEDGVAAFQKLAQGKSSISWEEFQELWKEFFASEDTNAPGNWIFCRTIA